MPLGIKVILILGLMATLALLAQIAVIGHSVLPAFDTVEREAARNQLSRVVLGLEAEVASLDDLAGDWAAWGDSYRFLKAPAEDYPHAELVYGNLASGQFDLFGFYNAQGDLLWGAVSDREIAGADGLAARLTAMLRKELPLAVRSLPKGQSGLLGSEVAPLIVSAHPVTPSATGDQPLGKLVIARFLEGALLDRMTRYSGASFETADDPALLDRLIGERSGQSRDPDTGTFLGLQRDIFGDPLLALRVAVPKGLMDQGRAGLSEAVGAFLIIALAAFILTLGSLQLVLLRPLTGLAGRIIKIGFEADWTVRLKERRSDVIGIIGREFDELLDRLESLTAARGSEVPDASFRPISSKHAGKDEAGETD